MKRTVLLAMILFIGLTTMGCGEYVQPGYVGMIMEPNGFTGEVLQPGKHWVGPRSKLILVEKQEMKERENLSILCADDLNFKFDVITRSRLNAKNNKALQDILDRQGSKIQCTSENDVSQQCVLKSKLLYSKYVQPVVLDVARGVVTKYETTSISSNRDAIKKEITSQVKAQMKNTPMDVVAIYLDNFDYPDVVTDAMTLTKKRQQEIKQREAQKAVDLLDASARREVAEQEKATRVAEAEKEAAYNRIVADSVTPAYIRLREIELEIAKVEAQKILYKNVGQGDKVIVVGGGAQGAPVMPIIQSAAAR
jgi:hypothetical protein